MLQVSSVLNCRRVSLMVWIQVFGQLCGRWEIWVSSGRTVGCRAVLTTFRFKGRAGYGASLDGMVRRSSSAALHSC